MPIDCPPQTRDAGTGPAPGTRPEWSDARYETAADPGLAARLATVPGLVRPGVCTWDLSTRLPLHPLAVESAYGDPELLRALAVRGADFARRIRVDVIVGAETGGIPLATAVSLASDLPFSFVRKPGYVGHEEREPAVRGASVSNRRVLLVDDAVASGRSVEAFVGALQAEEATVLGVFSVVDMRDVAECVSPIAAALPMRSIATYREVVVAAGEHGVLSPRIGALAIDAITNHWRVDDPRWALLGPSPAPRPR